MNDRTEHLVKPARYVQVLLALVALLGLTIVMAFINLDDLLKAHHLGAGWNAVVAVAIAAVKGLLILLFFMHVRYERRLTWVFASAGFVWLMVMLALTLTDYLSRPAALNP